ncbi:MAG: hypothetical protein NC911_07620 [Candidatus Omnitrophica bacterium]|nr:hypothetical protein [Candidatus Omnitrophota bacterium]
MNRTFWLLCLVLVSQVLATDRRLVEVEEFDGLVRYPYHRENAPGWYARESNCRFYGAPGKGYHAQIHEKATQQEIKKTLSPALEPGQYKVFLRVCGNSWHDRDNVVEVSLGKAKLKFSWQRLRRFEWLPGQIVSLSEPVSLVTLSALQFGGKGFRQLYESSLRTIAVDTLYITSDLKEERGPDVEGSLLIETGRDAPAEILSGKSSPAYRKVPQAETPEPLTSPRVAPVRLVSYDGRKNLWPNSSFEIGGNDGWMALTMNPSKVHIFDERDHLKGDAYHGSYSLKIPANMDGASRPVYLEKEGEYSFSLAIKGQEKASANILLVRCQEDSSGKLKVMDEKGKWLTLLSIPVNLSSRWQRVSAAGKLPEGLVVLRVVSPVDCLIDAVMLEPGSLPSPYQPRAGLEAGLATEELGNILYDDQPTVLTAWATNDTSRPAQGELFYEVVDVREMKVASGKIILKVPPNSTIKQPVVISQPPIRGLFSCFYHLGGRQSPEGELVYAVLPKISEGMPRHALAANMDNVEEVFRLMKRMGHKWQLYCKTSGQTSPRGINPQPDIWNWGPARETLLLPKSLGLEAMPSLWPGRLPTHLIDSALSETMAVAKGLREVVRSTKTDSIPLMPNLNLWPVYCEQLGRNLPEATWWNIEDETELYYTPKEFARIVKATAEGFRKSGRAVRLSLSCLPDYTEDLIAELGGEVPLGGFGGSSYNLEYWDGVKIRELQRRYGLPWHCIGVGWDNQPQMFHSFPGYKPVYASAARTAREMVFLCLVQDARIIGHYTGRIWPRVGLFNTDFPLMDVTGVPLPYGFSYSCVGLLLADAEPVKDIYLEDWDILIFVYRQKGRLGAITWANNTPNLDIHWKTWPRNLPGFTIPAAVDVLDMYANPVKTARISREKTEVELTEEPFFFLNRSLSDADFIQALSQATAPPPPVEMRLLFLPAEGTKGIDLGVLVVNNTKKRLKNLSLEADFPPDRMVTRTEWILKERKGKIRDILPNQQAIGRFPTCLGFDFPVENATFSVWLKTEEEEYPWYERCYLTVAPRVKSEAGRVTDWSGIQPAWIYHTFSWARFGRAFPQIVSGAGNLKYAFRTDGRVALRSGYDTNRLYFHFQVEDDSPVFQGEEEKRDYFQLRFRSNLVKSFASRLPPEVVVNIFPQANGQVKLEGLEGTQVLPWKREKEGYSLELSLPVKPLFPEGASSGQGLGFDFLYHDADVDGQEITSTLMRWAGGCRTLGQLFLGK